MKNPLLEEIYEARAQIWKECGETIEGYFDYFRSKSAEYADWPGNRRTAMPRRLRARPLRATSCKKAARP